MTFLLKLLCFSKPLYYVIEIFDHTINRYIVSNKKIGGCLTESDLNRIKSFVSEFTIHALFPWVERTLRSLAETVSHMFD